MNGEVDVDVMVVGGGPVGLLLAAELALGGAGVTVLERLAEPSTTIKAGSINLASAELLARRGLLDELRAASAKTMARVASGQNLPADQVARLAARAGHFAGIWLPAELVDETDPLLSSHRDALGSTFVAQADLETILAGHAANLDVEVHRGVAVTGMTQHDDRVVIDTDAGRLEARWVVGCDGGRSTVRHLAKFRFDGTEPEITGRQAVLDIADDSGLDRGWNWSTRGVYCYGPMPGRVLTVEFDAPPADRDAPVTTRELEASLRRVSGVEVEVCSVVGDATRWTDNARQADTYRDGRVLLAGDAAHVHSPFSGQGLNLGLADAMNLGWKLADVVTGRADASQLDTYTAERHPFGEWVLEWTRGQVALMRPDPKNGPLRAAMADLMSTPDGATLMATKIAGLARPVFGDDQTVGRYVPDVRLADGRMLRECFATGRFVLVAPDPSGIEVGLDIAEGRLVRAAAPDVVPMLVRPDGVIAGTF